MNIKNYAGVDFLTPAEAWKWFENQRNLTDAEKRRASSFIERWESSEGHKLNSRLKDQSEQIGEMRLRNLERIEAGQARTVEVTGLMKKGRMTEADGTREIARLAKEHRECLAVQESLRKSAERWEDDATQSVDDRLTAMRTRFPVLKNNTVRLTEAYLRGDEDSPFGGRS